MDGKNGGKSVAVLPPFKCYRSLSCSADFYAFRARSQTFSLSEKGYAFVPWDSCTDQEVAQQYNLISVREAMGHGVQDGREQIVYKGLSLVDLNFVDNNLRVFLPLYREALSFVFFTATNRITKVILEDNDPYLDLFSELAQQTGIELATVPSLGEMDHEQSRIVERVYEKWHHFDSHAPLRKRPYIAFCLWLINGWSRLVRLIRGFKKELVVTFYHPLNPIRRKLLCNKSWYARLLFPSRLGWQELLTSGVFYSRLRDHDDDQQRSPKLNALLDRYFSLLNQLVVQRGIGELKTMHGLVSLGPVLAARLRRLAPQAFGHSMEYVDQVEPLIAKERLQALLTFGDGPWLLRLWVRLCQRERVPTFVIMNGWLGDEFQQEAKTADATFCYGETIASQYFKDKDRVVITGNPLFQLAYNQRSTVCPKFPIRKILIGTYTFSGLDINSHYSDHEKYLLDIMEAIAILSRKMQVRFEISLRPHPSDPAEYYPWLLEKVGIAGVPVLKQGGFQEVVRDFDLAIMSYNTALFEAALMGIPVVFYHPSAQRLFSPFDGQGPLPSAFSGQDLQQILEMVFSDREYAYQFTRLQYLTPHTGPLDGGAGERILREIVTASSVA